MEAIQVCSGHVPHALAQFSASCGSEEETDDPVEENPTALIRPTKLIKSSQHQLTQKAQDEQCTIPWEVQMSFVLTSETVFNAAWCYSCRRGTCLYSFHHLTGRTWCNEARVHTHLAHAADTDPDFSPLEWWKHMPLHYLCGQLLLRRSYITLQSSSVAAERAFHYWNQRLENSKTVLFKTTLKHHCRCSSTYCVITSFV